MSLLYHDTVRFDEASHTYTVSPGIITSELNTLLNTVADFSTVRFETGTYILSEAVKVFRGNLTIEGAGEGKTVFEAQFDKPQSSFYFTGGMGVSVSVQTGAAEGATTVTLADVSKLAVGDTVRVYQANDADFIKQSIPDSLTDDPYILQSVKNPILASGSLYGNVASDPGMAKNPLRETLTEIIRIDGNTVTLKNPLAYAMDGGQAVLQRLNVLDNLKVSDFTVTTNLGTANPGTMVNDLPGWKSTNAMAFYFTKGIEIGHLTILDSGSIGLTAARMYEGNVHDLTIIGTHNKGDAANGYGLNIAGSQQTSFTGLNIFDTRHAVVFSSWGAEVGNTVHVTATNRDVNFHGSPDVSNIVVVEQSILDYYDATSPGWGVVATFGAMHPYTDVSRNDISFAYAIGSRGVDVIEASDYGAYLRGGAGADVLIGGRGNDVLIGDTQSDRMTGGKGADIFVFTNEIAGWGGTDIVTDFSRAEGDKLVFINAARPILESDVIFTDKGADTAITIRGTDLAVWVKNHAIGTIGLQDIILNAKPFSENPKDYHTAPIILVDTPVPRDPDMILKVSNLGEHIVGGSGNDTLIGWPSAFKGDSYDLGKGLDTISISVRDAWIKTDNLPAMKGVDVIDVSGSTTVSRVMITNDMIRQSDDHVLVLKNDTTVIKQLYAAITDKDLVFMIESAGDVYLADKSANVIHAHDRNTGTIFGGSGNEIFYGSATRDIFSGGGGKDIFSLIANKDGSADVIKDFSIKDDKLDISHLLFGYDPLQSAIANFVSIGTGADAHKTEIRIDRDGLGTAFSFETAVILETKIDMTAQEMLAGKNLIVV